MARGVDVRRWGRRGTVDIVACVAPRGTDEVLAGAPALREEWAYVPFERDEGLRPCRRARGPAGGRLGAVGGRGLRSEAKRPP